MSNDGCDQLDGSCTCKRNVIGRDCDQCLPEHYGLDPITDLQVLVPMRRGPLGATVLNERLQQQQEFERRLLILTMTRILLPRRKGRAVLTTVILNRHCKNRLFDPTHTVDHPGGQRPARAIPGTCERRAAPVVR